MENEKKKSIKINFMRAIFKIESLLLTFDPYFRGSSALPIFAANFVSGLVKVFNCLIAFSLCEWGSCDMGRCNFTSRSLERLN